MRRRVFSAVMFILLLTSMLSLTFNIRPAKGEPRTWTVDDDGPADFHTIQEAINAASAGDTISTRAGVYYGEVLVNKSVSLVGEDRETTIINGNGTLVNAGLLIAAHDVSVANVSVTNAPTGILIGGNNSVICNVRVFGTYAGIWVAQSACHGTITKSLIVNQTVHRGEWEDFGGVGIALVECLFYDITENNVDNNGLIGIWVRAGFVLVENNIISNNSRYGLELDWAANCSVARNHIVNNFRGIGASEASNCSIYANNIANNTYCAIEMSTASNNILIYHNNFVNNSNQVELSRARWDNGCQGNYWSDYNGTDADGDGIGDTPYVIGADNQDRYPLVHAWSSLPVHNINAGLGYATIQEAIDSSETLDGHLIFVETGTYYENVVVNKTISLVGEDKSTTIVDGGGDGGKGTIVIGVTASGVLISGFTVRNGMDGIQTQREASATTIDGNVLSNNVYGVHIYSNSNIVSENEFFSNEYDGVAIEQSSCNAIHQNVFEENGWGVVLSLSCHNVISQNIVTNSLWWGIALPGSYNNVIERNSLSNGGGISLGFVWDKTYYYPFGNTIFHNEFFNTTETYVTPNAFDNVWDKGYPSGGNYWSDYAGTDFYSGPNQNETGSDGIGDTPYIIDSVNIDFYPLVQPYVALAGDLNQDRTVDILDATLAALSFGSHPGHPNWSFEADLNNDGMVDIFDLIILASNFGAH